MSGRVKAIVDEEKSMVFEMIREGKTFLDIGKELGVKPDLVSRRMKYYKPYNDWKKEQEAVEQRKREEREKQIVEMTKSGMTSPEISKVLGIGKTFISNTRKKYGIGMPTSNNPRSDYIKTVRVVLTVEDVALFKRITCIGDRVQTDMEGATGIITSKQKWYADVQAATDEESYGIPWNWLCACNKERIGK